MTAIETRVVQLLVDGRTQREIAGVLSMGESAVRMNLLRARLRVGVSTTAQLIALAVACGWVSVPGHEARIAAAQRMAGGLSRLLGGAG